MAYSMGILALAMIRDIVTIAVHAGSGRAVVEIQKYGSCRLYFCENHSSPKASEPSSVRQRSLNTQERASGFCLLVLRASGFSIWILMFQEASKT